VSPNTKGALVLVAVYVLGGITGAAVVRVVTGRVVHSLLDAPPAVARQRLFMRALDREVHLEPGQRERIRAILRVRDGELRDNNRECAPKAKTIRMKALGEVREIMRPDQIPGFERFAENAERLNRIASPEPSGEASPER